MGDKTSKKPGFFQKLFSSKTHEDTNNDAEAKAGQKGRPASSSDGGRKGCGTERATHKTPGEKTAMVPSVRIDPPADDQRPPTTKRPHAKSSPRPSAAAAATAAAAAARRAEAKPHRRLSRKKTKKGVAKGDIAPADPNQRLEFPTTPETILSFHKRKPFLSKNEEWLIVELNEYECLVDSLDIIKTIANHSKFFEVEPDELWEEFFEYVEDIPSYDEVINYDVWQEFRDEKYPC